MRRKSGRWPVGVAVGKFNPPHLGHLHLIETGASLVDRLFVLLCDRPDQTIPVDSRRRWLEDAVGENVTIILTPDDLPLENEPWARRALEELPEAPHVAFTSEAWGAEWARLMGADHHLVDLERTSFPISATDLRRDLAAGFRWLLPAARAELARRIVLVGAESTGKTTLAESLAAATGSVWVPEHGRWYWEGRRYRADQSWTSDEFGRIATAQHRLADDLARQATNGLVIADTDALVTAVWHERYLGWPDDRIAARAAATPPALYLLCDDDFGWVQDGTRESEGWRGEMQRRIRDRVRASGVPSLTLTGPHERRLVAAISAIRQLPEFPELV